MNAKVVPDCPIRLSGIALCRPVRTVPPSTTPLAHAFEPTCADPHMGHHGMKAQPNASDVGNTFASRWAMQVRKHSPVFRRHVLAWCCYDWANSGYTTLIITVFVVYLQRVVFVAETWGNTGPIVWAWGIAVSMLLGAILSPIVGAMADARQNKRIWLAVTALSGGTACVAMAIAPPQHVWLVTACFLVANLCLELSLTVYNGFLPEIASDDEMNRVSAAGMGWGYLGGGLALLIAMLLLNYGNSFGLTDMSSRLRCCIALTGFWWAGFTLPTVLTLRDKQRPNAEPDTPATGIVTAVRFAAHDAATTLFQIRKYGGLALFLLAFLFFNDGVQTVISQSSTFALQEIHFTESELVGVILMVQFLAVPGAILIGWLSDQIGQKRALESCLLIWIGLLTSVWFVNSKEAYWLMAAGVALVLGGTQSVSRAIMGVLTPEQHAAKFFGFFNLSGKATSFMGTFVFGLVIAWTGNSRLAVVIMLVFFVIGLLILWRVNLPAEKSKTNKERQSVNSRSRVLPPVTTTPTIGKVEQ